MESITTLQAHYNRQYSHFIFAVDGIMDRYDALKTFVAVADRRSFSEVARALRISATAASRAVADLEKSLGVVLLRRTTRSVGLTPEGAAYLERCRAALNELDDAARSLRGESAEPRGALIVTAPIEFGRMHILPVVAKLLRAHPQLDVQLTLTDRIVRLVEEGIDIAVRIADLSDTALHAVRIAEVRRVLVASPGYLSARGAPVAVAQLREHDLIAVAGLTPNGEWRFTRSGRPAIRCEPRLLTNSVLAAIDAALDGLGIARVLSYQVDAHVQAGRLRYLLPEFEPPAIPVSLLFQASRRSSPNVHGLLAAAQDYFRSHPIGHLTPSAASA
jgi:DNA-binding transcriptional LysR family regulator